MLTLFRPSHRAIRQRRIRLAENLSIAYGGVGDAFGDCILTLQHALHASDRLGRCVGIYPYSPSGRSKVAAFEELIPFFRTAGRVELIKAKGPVHDAKSGWGNYATIPMINPYLEESAIEYELFEECWKPGPYHRMCYQFYGNSGSHLKSFKRPEAIRLFESFSAIEKVKVGLPQTVQQTVATMFKSDFFVGIDSGMTHLARCVGIPVFVHPNRISMPYFYRWHKQGSPSYTVFRSLPELHAQLRERLPWVLPAV